MIKIHKSELDGTVAVEISNDASMLKFYSSSNFSSGTVKLDAFLLELEKLELIPPRPKTTEHQASGLFDIVADADEESSQCGT